MLGRTTDVFVPSSVSGRGFIVEKVLELFAASRSDACVTSIVFHCFVSTFVFARSITALSKGAFIWPHKICLKPSNKVTTMDFIESRDSSTIRMDKDTKKGSVMDTIRMVLGIISGAANT